MSLPSQPRLRRWPLWLLGITLLVLLLGAIAYLLQPDLVTATVLAAG
ncbi:MAG: hypothetical protein ICV62_12545 [Cyanobacteria bacterium Co-bin13]|nr:hypothetical protein [Cyanobacteria bacterium Co-bin13]